MSCRVLTKVPGGSNPLGGVAIVCDRRGRRQRCSTEGCSALAVALCDYPLPSLSSAKRTCDRAMCAGHRERVPGGKDWCPDHKGIGR